MASRKWTEEEITFLKDNYGYISNEEIGKVINRTGTAINTYCYKHKIKHPRMWTEEEARFMEENYHSMDIDEIAESLGRSVSAVKTYAHKHHMKSNKFWTKEEEAFIEANYGRYTISSFSKKFGKSYKATQQKIFRMGIGAYHEQGDYITITEAERISGVCTKTIKSIWAREGLKIKKKSRFSMVKQNELYKFMENHPELWKIENADSNFLEYQPWFHERVLEERKKNDRRYA